MRTLPVPDLRAAKARVVSMLTGLVVALALVQHSAVREAERR